jgi:hypothetical protein
MIWGFVLVDIYLRYEDMTMEEMARQYDRFVTMGINGYLRGEYNGGYADVLKTLFEWADWSKGKSKMDIEAFERKLNTLKVNGGGIPNVQYDHKSFDERHFTIVDPQEIKEYENFLELAKKWREEGKDVYLLIRK